MDTDDLSSEAYEAVIAEADRFNPDLTLQFGLLSSECPNEEEFLKRSTRLIKKLRKLERYELEDVFFGNPPELIELHKALDKMASNIGAVQKIPVDERNFDF